MIKKLKDLAFQGDIALLLIDKLPEGVKKVIQDLKSEDREAYGYHPVKGLVLAQGESRQHYHAFRDTDKVEMYELAANDNKAQKRLFVVVKDKPQELVHEEHSSIEIEPNVYELIYQFEYRYDDLYARVID